MEKEYIYPFNSFTSVDNIIEEVNSLGYHKTTVRRGRTKTYPYCLVVKGFALKTHIESLYKSKSVRGKLLEL